MVIILNGVARSGKGTVYNFMNEIIPGLNYSWVNFARNVLREGGVPVDNKTPEMRECLAFVCKGLEAIDIPFIDCKSMIEDVSNGYIENAECTYIDCRDPKNIKRLKEYCDTIGEKCVTIFVNREVDCPKNIADISAKCVEYNYDYVINNNGTLAELKDQCYKIAYEI